MIYVEEGIIKALTLTQPYATLVAIGAKHYETRSRPTKYRGPLAIHAGMGWSAKDRALCDDPVFADCLDAYRIRNALGKWNVDPEALPRGCVLGIVNLADCLRIATNHPAVHAPLCVQSRNLTAQEQAFGDYTPGRYAWVLTDVYRVPTPIPAKGALGIWRWEPPDDLWLPEWAA